MIFYDLNCPVLLPFSLSSAIELRILFINIWYWWTNNICTFLPTFHIWTYLMIIFYHQQAVVLCCSKFKDFLMILWNVTSFHHFHQNPFHSATLTDVLLFAFLYSWLSTSHTAHLPFFFLTIPPLTITQTMAHWRVWGRLVTGHPMVLTSLPHHSSCPRCDPLHPAGGLPALLGRGPAPPVRPDKGRGVWLPQPRVGHCHPRGPDTHPHPIIRCQQRS